jgi:nitroreductase/NAD-dependent dihydropyrimidine dehydrogenase PreA subunit
VISCFPDKDFPFSSGWGCPGLRRFPGRAGFRLQFGVGDRLIAFGRVGSKTARGLKGVFSMAVMHSQYREGGTVRVDDGTCKRCGLCVGICAAEVLAMEDGRVRVRGDAPFGCIACGHCMMVCPEGSIAVTGRGISPGDLAAMPGREERAGAEALGALMRARRSVRRFTGEEVAPELLERMVEMAESAPMGVPPWDVGCVIVRGREKVRELAGEVVKGYEGFLKMFRPWVITLMRPFMGRAKTEQFRSFIRPLAETYVRHLRNGDDVVFYGAPAVLLFHHSPYAEAVDATIACTYAMLAAESLGLGTTMIGGAPPVIQRNKALCRTLGVPEGNTPAIALIAGHAAVRFRRAVRRRFSDVRTVC